MKYRRASEYVAARWALTRELVGVARELPAPVVAALAKGIGENDVAAARPGLQAYRQHNHHGAEAANVVLATRAPMLFSCIEGTLFVPKRPMPYSPITPLPEPPSITSSSRSSGSGALWIMIGVILLFVRVMRCDSSPSYDDAPKLPKFDPHITRELLEYRPLPDYSELYRIAPQPPLFSPTASEETLYWEMQESLGALQHYSQAGVKLFKGFQKQLTENFYVLHSVAWIGIRRINDRPSDGETDFIIIDDRNPHPWHVVIRYPFRQRGNVSPLWLPIC